MTSDTPKNPTAEIGAMVVRFQTSNLHLAHQELVNRVLKRHKKVIIFLGVSSLLNTKKPPLDFPTRKEMIYEAFPPEKFPGLVVLPLRNCRSDEQWSRQLDSKLREVFPIGDALLYGGNDSFIKHYKGQFPCFELVQDTFVSGTDLREEIAHNVMRNAAFRAGLIYAANNRFPETMPCVDAAIIDWSKNRILLGRKGGENAYRFVGGHFDTKEDQSYEDAVLRETREETQLETAHPQYVTSQVVADWRHEGEDSKIVTALYAVDYVFGCPQPADDIIEVRWFDLASLKPDDLVVEHRKLFEKLTKWMP